MEALRAAGHRVTVTLEGAPPNSRYFVVIDGYEVPAGWDRTTVDLLLIVPELYPNAKLDMFWVSPIMSLMNGALPQAADTRETYVGRTWQRFSWHPEQWRPGKDTIITYLDDVVAARLHQRK